VLRVFLWRDLLAGGEAADLACAAQDGAGLRAACRAAGLAQPARPGRARPTDDVVQLALAHPGRVLALGRRDAHWRLLDPG
jgi:hypothetical protein